VSTGFDSVWVSDRADRQVHRIDPDTGGTEAVIEVGSVPVRLQPADGRMVVRTADAYEFIDPATNTVAATLPKTDVGPGANRAWAVDGALWICDGERLHRYDPTTLQAVATLELGFACGNVYATDDLVIPWAFNEDAGESGVSVAALVDPASNSVRATIGLPVDVGKPTVIDEVVFFPGTEGSMSVVVDRTTGTIVSTPDLGRPFVHSNDSVFDGTHLYVMVEGRDIAVVDPETFEIVDTIEPMDFDPPLGVQINALALSPGALWVVNDESSILQRFDLDR
jgi:DNA-binding beta-propeller fold protein YncE